MRQRFFGVLHHKVSVLAGKQSEHFKTKLVLIFGLYHVIYIIFQNVNIRQRSALYLEIAEAHGQILFDNRFGGNVSGVVLSLIKTVVHKLAGKFLAYERL